MSYRFETLQLHVGQEQPDPASDARAVPIYATTSYVFHNAQHAADRFGLADPGNIYGRLTNSTQGVFEQRIAALEGGVAGLAVASGAAAITYTIQALAARGEHIVAQKTIYGGTANLLAHTLPLYGIESSLVDVHDLAAVEAAIQENTLYFALYGGLMAGLFEETGRFLAMKFLFKKEPTETKPGIAYGLGHGGMEMILIFGLSMISTLTMALMINLGQTDTLLSTVPAEAKDQLATQFEQIQASGAGTYLLGLWERFSAITLQVGLSVLVWAAARKGGKWAWLFPAAILLHALVDGVAVILSKSAGMVMVELVIMALAIAVVALAWLVARKAFRA